MRNRHRSTRVLAIAGVVLLAGLACAQAEARGKTPCESAKAAREKALRAAGMRRDFDLVRRLNDQVFAACQPAKISAR